MCCPGLGAYADARWLRASLGSTTKAARTAGFCSLCCVWGLFRADFRAIGRDRLMPFRISAGRTFEHCRGRIPNATQRAKTRKIGERLLEPKGPRLRTASESGLAFWSPDGRMLIPDSQRISGLRQKNEDIRRLYPFRAAKCTTTASENSIAPDQKGVGNRL